MITEGLILGVSYMAWYNKEEILIRRKWKRITESVGIKNKLGKSIKLWKYDKTDYGYDLLVELPYGYTMDGFANSIDIFKEALGLESIEMNAKNNMCILECVESKIIDRYSPYPLPPNKLYIAKGLNEPIIVDMNRFPHMLIGGDTGTGKSKLLSAILTNLVATTDLIDIYLLQMRKNDLEVFENCKQVISSTKDLKDIRDKLKSIDEECIRREQLIKPTLGYYNISDYNKANKPLKYVYVVIEEFSFLNRNGGDTKYEDELKKECLKYIKTVVNVGRSSGVFLITALQKPTKDSIPSDIKSQLTTRLALKICDQPASIVTLGNGNATELGEREVIIRTLGEQLATTMTIEHEDIMKYIKPKLVNKPKSKPKKRKAADIFETHGA